VRVTSWTFLSVGVLLARSLGEKYRNMRKVRACATSHYNERDELEPTTPSAFPIAITRTSVGGEQGAWVVGEGSGVLPHCRSSALGVGPPQPYKATTLAASMFQIKPGSDATDEVCLPAVIGLHAILAVVAGYLASTTKACYPVRLSMVPEKRDDAFRDFYC
jgi:hypothetical protein